MRTVTGKAKCITTDIVIIGGGPAGSAAAITAADNGLDVVLLERLEYPRHRPGETFHPGVEALFRQLGILDQILALDPIRHSGHKVSWAGRTSFQKFGGDINGEWLGFQILREQLDLILINRAKEVGVSVIQPVVVKDLQKLDAHSTLIRTDFVEIKAQVVIDASGKSRWGKRKLERQFISVVSGLVARYGYFEISDSSCFKPELKSNDNGWIWQTPVTSNLVAWTKLYYNLAEARRTEQHFSIPKNSNPSSIRGADVSWGIVWPPAEDCVFAVGEAAMSIDPLTSHGNLQALMSGIMSAHLAKANIVDGCSITQLEYSYNEWLLQYFLTDCEKLVELYSELDVKSSWVEDARSNIDQIKLLAFSMPLTFEEYVTSGNTK